MDVFQQGTKILRYETVQEFLRGFILQKKGYILASRSIYEASFRDSTGRASIAFHSDCGQGKPDDRMLDAMLEDMRGKQPEHIIAIGGSVTDCAKLSVLGGTASAGDMFLYRYTSEKSRELIAISTTCGSGSEASRISICEFASLHAKLGLTADTLYPGQAVLIPELLSKSPFFYFVTSGIDALIHTSESFASPKSNAYTRTFSTEAIRLSLRGSQATVKEGEDARMRLLGGFMQASNLAGIAFGNTGTGAAHALGHPPSGVYHVTHGEASYQFSTVIFQTYKAREKYSVYDVKKLFSETPSCSVEDVLTYMETLFSTLFARKLLHEYSMKESETKGFTDNVIKSQQRLLSNNAIPLSRDEAYLIYKALS